MERRLYRSSNNRVIAGVCAGLAEYLHVDVNLVRLVWVLLLFRGIGILAYLLAWLIIPSQVEGGQENRAFDDGPVIDVEKEDHREPGVFQGNRQFLGMVLILLGSLFLAENLWPVYFNIYFWPVLLIVGGAILLFWGGKYKN